MTTRLPPAIEAKAKRGPGRYSVGKGLYLLVRPNGARYWLFRYRDRVTGALRDKGLGSFPDVSLKDANATAADMRRLLESGNDPIDSARAARQAEQLERARLQTRTCCGNSRRASTHDRKENDHQTVHRVGNGARLERRAARGFGRGEGRHLGAQDRDHANGRRPHPPPHHPQ
ncbi:MAG: DUF4102 domain-containing protein [Proteobacteria bacterium]|nr:DUF4102 domain-containing protein [Pseudomonadota bacterium]